jgi:peptidoglycan/xylan/chitin deacetylase (PgdA/CDA1 family)
VGSAGVIVKRLVILLSSLGFLAVVSLWALVRHRGSRKKRGSCVVLYYHEVRPEHRAQFARQMDVLLRCAIPTRADHAVPLASGACYAAVTFDDGYLNVIQNALPELESREIPSTVFIVTEALGKRPAWMADSSSSSESEKIASADQLRMLPRNLVTVGSHTMTHRELPLLNEEDAKRELSESRAQLEKMLNKEIRLFSFPHGAFNANLVEWCREAGYERVFTILPTLAFSDPQEFVTGRVSVEPTDWPFEFRLKLLGAYRWLPFAFLLKRKMRSVPLLGATKKSKPGAQSAYRRATPKAGI